MMKRFFQSMITTRIHPNQISASEEIKKKIISKLKKIFLPLKNKFQHTTCMSINKHEFKVRIQIQI